MTLRELLSIPYVLSLESIPKSKDEWIRKVEYPELSECSIESNSPLEIQERLEELRIKITLEKLKNNEVLPCPRDPLKSMNVDHVLIKHGFHDWVQWLDIEVDEVRKQAFNKN